MTPSALGRRVSLEASRRLLSKQLDAFFSSCHGGNPISALEIGCGDGRVTERIWAHLAKGHPHPCTRLCAVDISLEALACSRKRLKTSSIQTLGGDLYNLPFGAEQFDCLIALNVFFWADRSRLLREACRVLRRHGRMFTYDLVPASADSLRPLFFFTLAREQILQGI